MEWVVRKKTNTQSHKGNVYIYSCEYQSKRDYKNNIHSVVTFINKSWKKVSRTCFLQFGIQGTRLYFREANAKVGYKLSLSANGENATIKVVSSVLPLNKNIEEGDYWLEYDNQLGLYYIDVKNKIEDDGIDWSHRQKAYTGDR